MKSKKLGNLSVGDKIGDKIKNLRSLKEYSSEEIVTDAEEIAEELKSKNVKTSQIRRIHSHIVKIYTEYTKRRSEMKGASPEKVIPKDELQFLKPLLAYIAARINGVETLKKVLSAAIDKVQDKEDFELFKKLYDSILAYHRFYTGER